MFNKKTFVVIIIIIVLLLFTYYYFMPKYTLKFNKQKYWSVSSGLPIKCSESIVNGWCLLESQRQAETKCNADPKCIGYWSRDGSWIGKAGKTIYQLVETPGFTPAVPPASFYLKPSL